MALALYSTSRDVFGDIIVYYGFYDGLATAKGTSLALTCSSFEPLYCGGSYLIREISGTAEATHLTWVALYYVITAIAFRKFWIYFFDTSVPDAFFTIVIIFVFLNYIEPQQISYLVRQYVSSSFLMLSLGALLLRQNPFLTLAAAVGLHFGSLPIAIIIGIAHKGFSPKWIALGAFLFLTAYAANPTAFQLYLASVKLKLSVYQTKNDGDVTAVQEVRLFLYIASCLYVFRRDRKIFYVFLSMYVMYVMTMSSALFHLRYYKYFEVIAWPSVFIVAATPMFRRFDRGCLLLALSAIRLYKYVALAGDGFGAPSLIQTAVTALAVRARDIWGNFF